MDGDAHLDGFSGAVLVRRAGTAILDRCYGDADRQRGVAVTPATQFQLASVSKQFTAAAILLLHERGALSLDDAISGWIPQCPAAWSRITVHHLLTHSSGIGHWSDFPEVDLYQPTPRDRVFEIFFARPLRFQPGDGWYYSSPAYVFLAHIVEQASGAPYHRFLDVDVFRPLGLEDTSAGSGEPGEGSRAKGYSAGEPVRSFDLDTFGLGAGDVWSSARDVARWNQALLSDALLTSESRSAMFRPQATVSPQRRLGYGYGVFIGTLAGRPAVYHPGDNRGFQAFVARLPDDDVLAVLLSNDDQTRIEAIATELIRAALA